jgi:hypothetical protein
MKRPPIFAVAPWEPSKAESVGPVARCTLFLSRAPTIGMAPPRVKRCDRSCPMRSV